MEPVRSVKWVWRRCAYADYQTLWGGPREYIDCVDPEYSPFLDFSFGW